MNRPRDRRSSSTRSKRAVETEDRSSVRPTDDASRFESVESSSSYASGSPKFSKVGSNSSYGEEGRDCSVDRGDHRVPHWREETRDSRDHDDTANETGADDYSYDFRRSERMAEGDRGPDSQENQQRVRSGFRRSLGDKLLSGLFESGEVLRRGQGLVSEVAQVTKGELVRIVGAEVRTFLDKVDVSDLVQEIMSGLVLEVKTEVRFTRDSTGKIRPKAQETQTRFRPSSNRTDSGAAQSESDRGGAADSSDSTRDDWNSTSRRSGSAFEDE